MDELLASHSIIEKIERVQMKYGLVEPGDWASLGAAIVGRNAGVISAVFSFCA